MNERLNVGIYLFENMTMLDAYAPLQVLSMVPAFNTFTFAGTTAPLRCDSGVDLLPQYGLGDCPALDILVMPGGGDVSGPVRDERLMAFLRARADRMQYITSVCSGALVLAEAGLLDGYRATTHWAYLDTLRTAYPAVSVVDERVAVDRNRLTGGGVTAGIDFALTLVSVVVDPAAAQAVQLLVEYRPQPPFDAGSPVSAPAPVLAQVQQICTEVRKPLEDYLATRVA